MSNFFKAIYDAFFKKRKIVYGIPKTNDTDCDYVILKHWVDCDFKVGLDAVKRDNYTAAFEEWKPLAEHGDIDSQCNLGCMYANGLGVPQDDKEAVRLYRLAVEQGHATAQSNLGASYARGKGVPQDDKEAVRLYRLADEQGNDEAQINLG